MATWVTMQAPSTDPSTAEAPLSAHPLAMTFAAWLAGSAARGLALICAAAAAGGDVTAQLAAVLDVHRGPRNPRRRMAAGVDLDGVLRSDSTVAVEMDHPLIRGDVRRLRVLQHELQRACLTATLTVLPPTPRAAFILLDILGLPFDQAAEVVGGVEALRTAHRRARSELDAYLGPRCEHVDPKNVCHCATRLGVALRHGFIGWPDRDDLASDGPLVALRGRKVPELFAGLSPPF